MLAVRPWSPLRSHRCQALIRREGACRLDAKTTPSRLAQGVYERRARS
jgi:hypothetical protein